MSDIALAETHSVTKRPQPSKRHRISPRMRRAVDALVSGEAKTQKEAAAIAGIDRTHLCRELNKPHIEAFVERRTRETIGRARMRASARIVELLDADSEHVAADVAKWTLGVAGIKPADQAQIINNINVLPGYTLGRHLELEANDETA